VAGYCTGIVTPQATSPRFVQLCSHKVHQTPPIPLQTNVAKKPFSDRTRGVIRGRVESGFLKNGDRRGALYYNIFATSCDVSHSVVEPVLSLEVNLAIASSL